jgi:2-hydroxychromene-2-carboxylate isomerase
MSQDPPRSPLATLWFDFVDPLSYLLELEMRSAESALPGPVERVGLEIVPPPAPLAGLDDAPWSERFALALHAAGTAALGRPRILPWTRKAHELHLHAAGLGKAGEVRLAVFQAYFERGEDIGRIDRLVAIAEGCGLDPATARTVLGVDRHEEEVLAARAAAAAAGVTDVPALVVAGRIHRGFHNRAALLTLRQPAAPHPPS